MEGLNGLVSNLDPIGSPARTLVEKPLNKCQHGVYRGDEERAHHCGLCNPDLYSDVILLKTMARHKPAARRYAEERTRDCADFMSMNPEDRIASARQFYEL